MYTGHITKERTESLLKTTNYSSDEQLRAIILNIIKTSHIIPLEVWELPSVDPSLTTFIKQLELMGGMGGNGDTSTQWA